MSSTRVPSTAASDAQSRPSCPDAMVTWRARPRWVTGMPAAAGTATALVTPGHDLDGDARGEAGQGLLAAAAEHERVAALEPHDAAAGLGVLDEQPVDLVLGQRVVAGGLADVDDDDRRVELVQQRARGEPVDEHDVGLGEQPAAAGRDQAGVARAAADQRHAAGRAAGGGAAAARRCRGRGRSRRAGSSPDAGRRRR